MCSGRPFSLASAADGGNVVQPIDGAGFGRLRDRDGGRASGMDDWTGTKRAMAAFSASTLMRPSGPSTPCSREPPVRNSGAPHSSSITCASRWQKERLPGLAGQRQRQRIGGRARADEEDRHLPLEDLVEPLASPEVELARCHRPGRSRRHGRKDGPIWPDGRQPSCRRRSSWRHGPVMDSLVEGDRAQTMIASTRGVQVRAVSPKADWHGAQHHVVEAQVGDILLRGQGARRTIRSCAMPGFLQ